MTPPVAHRNGKTKLIMWLISVGLTAVFALSGWGLKRTVANTERIAVQERALTSEVKVQDERWDLVREDLREIKQMLRERQGSDE